MRRLRILSLLFTVIVITSCDQQPTEPWVQDEAGDGLPQFTSDPTPPRNAPGTLTGTITPAWSNVGVGPVALGTFSETTYVRVTTVSTVNQYWSDAGGGSFAGADLGPRGPSETQSSSYGCWNHPYYVSAYTLAQESHCPGAYGSDDVMIQTKTTIMYGAVNAWWKAKLFKSSGNCDNNGIPCYRYTGSYTVTIEPTFQFLRLTASASRVARGDSVTFIASTSDARALTIRQWTWVPDDSTASASNPCGTTNPCRIAVPDSGVMYVRARVGAKVEQQSASVAADSIACATSDPVLNDVVVRQTFRELMRKSNPDSAPGSGIDPANPSTTGHRKERGAWIYRRADGSYYTVEISGPSYECSLPGMRNWPFPEPGAQFVGTVHTHPGKPGDKTFGLCTGTNSAGQTFRPPLYPGEAGPGILPGAEVGSDYLNGGGSLADWANAIEYTQTVYVMNAVGEVWKLPGFPNTKPLNPNTSNRHIWQSANSLCNW